MESVIGDVDVSDTSKNVLANIFLKVLYSESNIPKYNEL
jgi:hypothetical protein